VSLYGDSFFEGRSPTVVASASVVVPRLQDLLSPRSLLDIGCGKGEWLEAFGLDDSLGVDIAAPEGVHFLNHDLTKPLDLERTYDVVLSLEVGEHLPEQSAQIYCQTMTRHTDTIVFSAAVVGQEGIGHINCQPHEYWHQMLDSYGFAVLDAIRPMIQDPRVSPWYRDNIFLYQRR
jgi:2-polyprenyl-3-methyl-5-hydroxy-6-metoxy-1,4-benzoquinol methylase